MDTKKDTPKFGTRADVAEFLTANGYPTPLSTLHKLSIPSVGQGPPVHHFWSGRPIYELAAALRWAQERAGQLETTT